MSELPASRENAARAPVHETRWEPERVPEKGIALCLSGGGYRAMLFHVGTLWRLNDAGYLPRLDRISSVSGGSITAAQLGIRWQDLSFGAGGVSDAFEAKVVGPIRALASRTIDVRSVLRGVLLPGNVGKRIERAYRKHLYGDATLQRLPDQPRFVINATNMQSGVLWRFSRPYMGDYRVGRIERPDLPLARAVAASSAFPPVLSPVIMKLEEADYLPGSGTDLQRPPYTTRVVLSDGGVYDNLGLETAWKRYDTILVSDAGGLMSPEPRPEQDWPRHTYRVLNVIDSQVRSLRKRQVIKSYVERSRRGAYWGIRTNIADYQLADPLPCPHNRTLELANISTRLEKLDELTQERLINWGYAVCDAALRKHVDTDIPESAGFPYSGTGV